MGLDRLSGKAHELNAIQVKKLSLRGRYADGNRLYLTVSDRDLKAGFFASLCGAEGVIWALALWILSALKKLVIWQDCIDASPDQVAIFC